MCDNIAKISYEDYTSKSPSTYASWMTNDVAQILNNGVFISLALIEGGVTTIISIFALISIHWLPLSITLIMAIIMLAIPKIFNKQLFINSQKLSQANEDFLKTANDFLQGYKTLFGLRQLNFLSKNIIKESQSLGQSNIDYQRSMTRVITVGTIANIISQILLLTVSGSLAMNGIITVGAITTTSKISSNIFNAVGSLSQNIATIGSIEPLCQKIFYYSKSPKTDQPHSNQNVNNQGYVIKNLSVNFNKERILNNVHYNFKLGGKYAITGSSGSGKSTLLNLLSGRLSSYSGQITLFGKNIDDLTYDEIYDQIFYVEQTPHIFELTLRDNLNLGENFTDDDIWSALQKVNLDHLFSSLPYQLDTVIGDSHQKLSGGQLQRLAIARGLLRKKKLFLLDEATANLDKENASYIEKMLLNNPDLTVIMVTHHLNDETKNLLNGVLSLA